MTKTLALIAALLFASSAAAAATGDSAQFRAEYLPVCTIATTAQELPPGAEIRVRVTWAPGDVGLSIALRDGPGVRHVPNYRNGSYRADEIAAGQVISYKVTESGRYALNADGPGDCVSGAFVEPDSGFDRLTLGGGLLLDAKVIMPAF